MNANPTHADAAPFRTRPRLGVIALAAVVACATVARSAPPATQPAPPAHRDPVLPPPLPAATSQPAMPTTVPAATTAAPVAPLPKPAPPAPTTAPVVVPAPPATQPTPPPPPAATAPLPIPDPVAYTAGFNAGKRIRAHFAEDGRGFDDLVVVKGLIDGLADHNPAFPRADVQAAIDQLQANVLQRRAEKRAGDDPGFRRLADDNGQRSRDLLAQNGRLPEVRVRTDGVQLRVLKDGTGRPVATAKGVTAKLTVSLLDGTPIATTGDKPVKLTFTDVLPTLVDVARGMRVGDRWQVVLPPDKAYGLAGDPPMIGPNQAVAYDFEVTDVQ